ncbi:hypothetical protein [Megamonas hypermegale]|jgi:hypothetical protein|uniref:hypothetical protein n=1 Tax=Megamonas hypermegale TaxID=158847 RepID=UPI0024326A8F|nr:hypothetical protein [Megamonas hypermegale]
MKKLSRKYMRENFHKLGVVQFGYRIPADKPITEALKEAMISLRKNYDLKNVTMNNVIYTSDSFIRMRKNGTYSQVFLKKGFVIYIHENILYAGQVQKEEYGDIKLYLLLGAFYKVN